MTCRGAPGGRPGAPCQWALGARVQLGSRVRGARLGDDDETRHERGARGALRRTGARTRTARLGVRGLRSRTPRERHRHGDDNEHEQCRDDARPRGVEHAVGEHEIENAGRHVRRRDSRRSPHRATSHVAATQVVEAVRRQQREREDEQDDAVLVEQDEFDAGDGVQDPVDDLDAEHVEHEQCDEGDEHDLHDAWAAAEQTDDGAQQRRERHVAGDAVHQGARAEGAPEVPAEEAVERVGVVLPRRALATAVVGGEGEPEEVLQGEEKGCGERDSGDGPDAVPQQETQATRCERGGAHQHPRGDHEPLDEGRLGEPGVQHPRQAERDDDDAPARPGAASDVGGDELDAPQHHR